MIIFINGKLSQTTNIVIAMKLTQSNIICMNVKKVNTSGKDWKIG